jgi:hypothetical protein
MAPELEKSARQLEQELLLHECPQVKPDTAFLPNGIKYPQAYHA